MDNLKDLEAMSIVVKEFRTISKANRVILLGMLTREHEVLGDRIDDPFLPLRKQWVDFGRPLNQKISFIKAVRELAKDLPGQPFYGVKEAKELVESW